jgi:hypothetical protein
MRRKACEGELAQQLAAGKQTGNFKQKQEASKSENHQKSREFAEDQST